MNQNYPSPEELYNEIDHYYSQNRQKSYSYQHLLQYLSAKYVVLFTDQHKKIIQNGILNSSNFISYQLPLLTHQYCNYTVIAWNGSFISGCYILPIFQAYVIIELHEKIVTTKIRINVKPSNISILLKTFEKDILVDKELSSEWYHLPSLIDSQQFMIQFMANEPFDDFLLIHQLEIQGVSLFD